MNLYNNLTRLIKKGVDFFTYYYFLIDLYLLEFFSRKYQYLIFIFSFFYGTFGYTNALTISQYLAKMLCFFFSWYLISASVIVFCAFNIPVTKKYLYNLLGKEFVIGKIGNPGLDALARFGGFAALGLTANELGRVWDTYAKNRTCTEFLKVRLDEISKNPDLTTLQKQQAVLETLKVHGVMSQAPTEGTLDRITKVEAHQNMMNRFSESMAKIFRK